MHKPDLQNKHVVVVGLGLTGQSCVRFLQSQGAKVTAMDTNPNKAMPEDVTLLTGEFDQGVLCSADMVVLSPGIDPRIGAVQGAISAGIEVIGDVELFARFNTIPVIAITGSNGKSTVTSLVAEILNCAGIKALMGGNIGTPVLELLHADAEYLVLELSSFQLETLSSLAPVSATILNVTEDHLDRHLTLANYSDAKQRIYHQAKYKIANRDDSQTWPQDYQPQLSFGLTQSDEGLSWDAQNNAILRNGLPLIVPVKSTLSGSHNMLNIQAAIACVLPLGIKVQAINLALGQFRGLSHRFELVSQFNHVRWINDSKATNVGATIAAIQSLANRSAGKLILIAGGDGKNADFTELQGTLLNDVDLVITLGKDGRTIAGLKPGSVEVASLEEAVAFAAKLVEKDDVVLLSPACASLDMFDNYQHRGEVFKQSVLALQKGGPHER
ncbi:UDP-N-acetylmuramoyl-L-alanine--D-glutamate ligase [Aliiglaciecola sp. LCG003]|uniref:UDP-N-acetylmuramoyl-L-alanine--D-glutamate ligase n=1 Tax=Aliiglaciecola sp. LCG003 TaxID=3053655 RepID=UPI002574616B|nr:UDP-N-acetylmuramoyl-L-alanine--D-glutamate ligase [Aliiglaciecola sp. LCG003]WJG08730.1 UDP-N-acetylmuramoyl-L-alanine--D-glutamate ligase [Aliiglaciecola sp. LCG003]